MQAPVFPVYLRLADDRHFYRVEGPTRFTEIQRIGGRYVLHHVEARAYPELVRIQDMIEGANGRFTAMEAGEWEALYARI